MTKKSFILYLFIVLFSTGLKGQVQDIQWSLILDGFQDVDLADLVVDTKGNTYAAINYGQDLKIPGLKKVLPIAEHIHGSIIKIDKNGKPVWVHAFDSDFVNKINDIDIAPNGDLLITGLGDGLLCFPGLKDTLKVGIPTAIKNSYQRYPGFYAARYNPDGERLWVQYFNCQVGEGMSIAANRQNEVYMTYYHKSKITQNETLIDTISPILAIKNMTKYSLASFDTQGKLKRIQNLAYNEDIRLLPHKIKFDNQNNLILYGLFNDKIKLSDKDSLTNDKYYENYDSYLAKYNSSGTFLWARKIGGQHRQTLQDITIAKDNSIYLTGAYDTECIVGTGINVIQKNESKEKLGDNFFYMHLFDDGELDFLRCEDNEGYSSYFSGKSIALDKNQKIHIVGYYTNSLRIDSFELKPSKDYECGFYSYWKNNKLIKIEKVGDNPKGWLLGLNIACNGNAFATGGIFYANGSGIRVKGKKQLFPKNEHGRNTFIYGGKIPDEITSPEILASRDSIRQNRINEISPLLACYNTEKPLPDLWFKKDVTETSANNPIIQSPCGEEVKGMDAILFPNPTRGEVNIKVTGILGVCQFDVLSDNGQLLLTYSLQDVKHEQIITFDLSQLKPGTYFVRVSHKNYEKAISFIKVN